MELAWIVSSDDEVEFALAHEHLVVRPPGERVPESMRGTLLGEIFERLARMNDRERHTQLRARVESRIAAWDLDEVRRIAAAAATHLPHNDVAAYTIVVLIGLRDAQAMIPWIGDFAAAIAFGASEQAVSRGIIAAQRLADALPRNDDRDDVANALGFLFQSYAATARLIESLSRGTPTPPVVMTRRWAARDTQLCGRQIRRGDAVAILLTSPRFHFGSGPHACPGRNIAYAIAEAALDAK